MAEYIDRDNLIKDFECSGGRFVYGDITGMKIPSKLDKQYYIDLAKKRLEDFGVRV